MRRTYCYSYPLTLTNGVGQLFIQQAVLGGCLQTTKVTDAKETSTETKSKEDFKAEVGVAVQTSFGAGGSVKASHETQSGKEHVQSNLNQREAMSFEATGGILSLPSGPHQWETSITSESLINQSSFPWSMPSRDCSEYLVVPESRTLDVRFKLVANTPTMAKIVGSEIPTYLGHDPLHPPVPRKTARANGGGHDHPFCVESKLVSKDAIFFPAGTQAPVLFQPTEYQPLDANGDLEPLKAQDPNEPTAWNKVGTLSGHWKFHTAKA
ncbi:hypothetical protein BJX70DRAFT_398508 [Aspergillus crustosus]